MLNPVAGKNLHVSVVHPNGKADDERPLWKLQAFAEVEVKSHRFRCLIELRDGKAKGRCIKFLHRSPLRKPSFVGASCSGPVEGKHCREGPSEFLFDGVDGDCRLTHSRHGCYSAVGQATRMDSLKRRQIQINIQSEPV